MSQAFVTTHDHTLGSAYAVSLPVFQGPLDLLLQLIEKEELDISEVSLLAVTDQYVQTIATLEELEPGALADFLVIASRLLYMKSLSLLPKPHAADEEDEEGGADALIQQLLEYRRFKQAATLLQEREELGLRVYVRTAPQPELERRLDLSNVDLNRLQMALRRVLQRMPNEAPLPRVKTYPITVAEQIDNVRGLLQEARQRSATDDVVGQLTFSELLGRGSTRVEVVVTFLAILELIKQRELAVEQEDVFGEIRLRLLEPQPGEEPELHE
ncbi:MAG: segregation/condensation protein A [Caldilineaceae bacterium]